MRWSDRAAIEELARLLDGDLPIERAGEPVRQLATMAATLGSGETVPAPTPAFRAALRDRLVDEISAAPVSVVDRVRDAAWQHTSRLRHSVRAGVATAVASGMLGSAGVAVAAQQALPGELLYGMKRATESVRLAVAGDLAAEARVHLAVARERLGEIRDGAGSLHADQVIDTLGDMDEASIAGADALLQAVADGQDAAVLDELARFTEDQRSGLAAAYAALPASARPFADRSFEVLRRIDVQVAVASDRCGVCGGTSSPTGPSGPLGIDRFDRFVRPPGEGPAVSDRPTCGCVAPDPAPPVRDPGAPPSDVDAEPRPEPRPEEPRPPEEPGRPGLVPPLPGPLEPIGDAVDDTIGGLLDTVEEAPGTLPGPTADADADADVETPSPAPGAVTPSPGPVLDDVTDLLSGH